MCKEKKNERITIRCTASEKLKLENESSKLGMELSTYCRDKCLKGKERNTFKNRIMCKTLVSISFGIDSISDLLKQNNSENIPKSEIMPIIIEMKKGCNDLWNLE